MLTGVRVLVTRAKAQAIDLEHRIEALGGEAIVEPCIRIEPPLEPERVRAAVVELTTYDWVLFTSVNGVERFVDELPEGGIEALARARIAAVGSTTAAALERFGVQPEVVPDRYVAESLLAAVRERVDERADERAAEPADGRPRVLLPVAEGARTVLERGLREAGAFVERVHLYRAVPAAENPEALRQLLASGGVDVVTLTSPSTVEGFVDAVGTDLGGARVVAIGPITSEAARRRGLDVSAEADPHTTEGLVEAIITLVRSERSRSST